MSSGAVDIVTNPSCPGGASCVEMNGYSELYFNKFSLVGARSAVIAFNLCIGSGQNVDDKVTADSPSPSSFYVYFQCSPSSSPSAAAPWKLLKSYPSSTSMTRYSDQRLTLPPECDNVAAVNLVFTARSFTANVLLDSFEVTADSDSMTTTQRPMTTIPRPIRSVVERLDPSRNMDVDAAMYTMKSGNVANMVDAASSTEGRERIDRNERPSTLRSDHAPILEAEAPLTSTTNMMLDIDFGLDVDGVADGMAGWMRLEWSLRNWWMLYVTVFVMGIMIGSASILLGLICLKRDDKIDVPVRKKWTAFLCVFIMGIVVGSVLIAATIAFVLKLL